MDKRKMYAHVYFDIPGNSLGIAIYSLAKIPGFSGKLDPQLKDLTGHGKAYSLFLDTLGSGRISQEELQQGRIFQYNQLEEQVKKLELLGKLIAKDKEAQVVIDLDDLNFWFEAKLGELSSSQRDLIRKKLPQDQKDSLASQCREETLSELKSVSNVEELYDAMQADGNMNIRMYAMLTGWDKELLNEWYEKGPHVDPEHRFTIRSIKLNCDGALGSRGAWLLEPYSDQPDHFGHETLPMNFVKL